MSSHILVFGNGSNPLPIYLIVKPFMILLQSTRTLVLSVKTAPFYFLRVRMPQESCFYVHSFYEIRSRTKSTSIVYVRVVHNFYIMPSLISMLLAAKVTSHRFVHHNEHCRWRMYFLLSTLLIHFMCYFYDNTYQHNT